MARQIQKLYDAGETGGITYINILGANNEAHLSINRNGDSFFDTAVVTVHAPEGITAVRIFREELKALNPAIILNEFFGEKVGSFFELREAQLTKLENVLSSLAHDALEVRRSMRTESREEESRLNERYSQKEIDL